MTRGSNHRICFPLQRIPCAAFVMQKGRTSGHPLGDTGIEVSDLARTLAYCFASSRALAAPPLREDQVRQAGQWRPIAPAITLDHSRFRYLAYFQLAGPRLALFRLVVDRGLTVSVILRKSRV